MRCFIIIENRYQNVAEWIEQGPGDVAQSERTRPFQSTGPACHIPCIGGERPGAPKKDSVVRQKFGDFEYALPNGWTKENAGGGQLLLAPDIENNWQANLFLEYRDDPDDLSLEKAQADLVLNLKDRKRQFREVSRKVEKHPSGFQIGTLEYTSADQGTPLTEWEIMVDAGKKKRLFVLASSATASWTKQQPVFQKFVESLKKSGP